MKIKNIILLSGIGVSLLFTGCADKQKTIEKPKIIKEYVLPDEYNLIEKEFNKKLNSLIIIDVNDPNHKRFVRKNNIVIDTKKHLMWEDDNNNKKMNWYEAKNYCNNLKLDNFTDWKLPTIKQLQSIVDISNSPVINQIFKNVQNGYYWSSISYLNNANHPWRLNFQDGNSYYGYNSDKYYVRCVRNDLVFQNFEDLKIYSSVKFYNKPNELNKQIFVVKNDNKIGILDNIMYSNEVFEDISKVYNNLLNIYFHIYMKYLPPVQKPIFPPAPTLVKSQFETKQMFKQRIQKAIQQRKEEIKKLQQEYLHNVEIRNAKIKILEPVLLKKLSEFQKGAFEVILGTFSFENPKYDAETQTMYVTLKSSRSNYNKRIAIFVPIKIAKSFYNDINRVEPIVSFKFTPNTITLTSIFAKYNNTLYKATLTNKDYQPETIEVRIKDNEMDFNNTKQISNYFNSPILKSIIILDTKSKSTPKKTKLTKTKKKTIVLIKPKLKTISTKSAKATQKLIEQWWSK